MQSLLALWLFQKFVVARGRGLLLLVGLLAALLSCSRVDCAAHRSPEHHGLHAHPFEPVPIAAALVPDVHAALGLLLVRSALSQMDVPTRSSYVMAARHAA